MGKLKVPIWNIIIEDATRIESLCRAIQTKSNCSHFCTVTTFHNNFSIPLQSHEVFAKALAYVVML